MPETLYTVTDIADLLDVSRPSIYDRIQRYNRLFTFVMRKNQHGIWVTDEAGLNWIATITPHLKVGRKTDAFWQQLLHDYPPPPPPDV